MPAGSDGDRPVLVDALWEPAVGLVTFAALVSYAVRSVADPDLWGHVLFGRWMRARGAVTREDPYSYLSAPEWINHEWLAEVAFGGAWEVAGTAGLVLLKAVIVLGVLLLVYLHLREQGLDVLRAGLLVVALSLPVSVALRTIRPHMFTMLLFTATLLVLLEVERGRPRAAWLLPPFMAVWINLHGGVLAGLGVVLLWAGAHAARIVRRERSARALFRGPRLGVAAAVGACVPALLLNPYGHELPLFLVETATVPRPAITEWAPLQLGSLLGAVYLAFLAGGATALILSDRPVRPAPALLLAVAALLPFSAVRHVPLFAISVLVLAAPQIADVVGREGGSGRGSPWLRGAAILACVGAAVVFLSPLEERLSCIPVEGEDGPATTYPVRAVSLLEESGASGQLAVRFGWGEYAIWHLYPDFRVSMDGRRETVYPEDVYQNHLDFLYGNDDWDRVLETHPTHVALVAATGPTDNLLELKPGWRPAHRDSVAALHVREGTSTDSALAAVGDRESPRPDGTVCFPGPGGEPAPEALGLAVRR